MLRRRCQHRLLTLPGWEATRRAGPAFPGPTFDKTASGNQAGTRQHTVLHDSTGSGRKDAGDTQTSLGSLRQQVRQGLWRHWSPGRLEGAVQRAGQRTAGVEEAGRDPEAANAAGVGRRTGRGQGGPRGPAGPSGGVVSQAARQSPPATSCSASRRQPLLLPLLLRNWCQSLE